MPVIVSPLFWEWFNIWLIQFLKDLYHEIKMVALRGGNSSLNNVNHGCGVHSGRQGLDTAHHLHAPLGMQHVNSHQNRNIHANHSNHGNQPNVQSVNNISLQFVTQQNPATIKHEPNSRYSTNNCMQPSHHYRLLTQSRPECYLPSGAASGNYIPSAGAQNTQQGLRGQTAPQPSAPPAPQQDMSKTTMAGPSYVTPQNQTQQARPQYPNYPYRGGPQHGTRPTSHPRQQQPYLGGAGATTAGPVMYHHPTLVFQPPHMGIPQTYQQPRSNTSGYYPHILPYIGYTATASPGPQYYYPNGQQIPAGTVGTNPGRSNPGGLVPQQVTAPATPATPIPHPQPQPHIHPTMSGIQHGPPKRSHRLAIIDPSTNLNILNDLDSNDNNSQSSNEQQNERQTPQPDKPSIAEQFTRMVSEVANQPSSCESAHKSNFSKSVEVPATTTSINQPHTNPINSLSIVKSDIVNTNENKNLGPDVAEPTETPVVSAISDSPVVVPKMSLNVKQLQKSSEQSQPLVVDNNKNIPINKQQKQKNKPFVPQDELEKQSETVHNIVPSMSVPQTVINTPTPIVTNATFVAPQMAATLTSSTKLNESTPRFVPASGTTSMASTITTSTTFVPKTPIPTAPALSQLSMPPQPQRIKEPRERVRSEDKEKLSISKDQEPSEKEVPKPNGPTSVEISSVDSLTDAINTITSLVNQPLETPKVFKQIPQATETEKPNPEKNSQVVINKETTFLKPTPTATELLSASIEKVAKEQPIEQEIYAKKEESSAIQAQAKLAHSIASVTRNHSEAKMKDINLNSKPTDPDTSNGNTTVENVKEEVTKNEKAVKNAKNNNKKSNKMANDSKETKVESYENGKDETDKINKPEPESVEAKEEPTESTEKATAAAPAVFVPKYKYSEDQWSPFNKSGKKHYDIDLLMQIKDDPLSKNKPDVPLLETCNVMRTTPMQEPMIFNPITRPMNDTFYPNFLKPTGVPPRNNVPKETKKEGRSMPQSGKGSAKLSPSVGGSGHKPVIHVSLSLREEVKLNQTKDAWRPTRFKKECLTEEEAKTQELYKKFRGILNKLTPQKFDTLLERVKSLEINTKSRLEGVIDLIFEKAIDEPNFSEAYAAMCNKLSMIKVPASNSPDQWVNFRILIINRCQTQFVNVKVDEQVQKLEQEVAECNDPVKKKELLLQLEEENRRVRMRSVGNVRFIGELYKLKMLTSRIMVFCMNHLVEKLEEEKLECLCKLLTTIGEQVESEAKEPLEAVFKKMQSIVDSKSDRISSRVRFMIQDVIELKRRKWVTKNVVDSQPKMMDQIQKEAEQQQRHIELMNSAPMGGDRFRREDGGRGKRGDSRRQNNNTFMDNSWKFQNYTVDTSKFKAVTQKSNVNNIKLAPHNSAWNQGSGTKNPPQTSSSSMISLTKNKYSVLENVQADPTTLRTTKDLAPSYHHSKSIERSTFNSRGDSNNGSGSRSGSIGVTRSNSGSRSLNTAQQPTTESASNVAQEPLPEDKVKQVKISIMDHLSNPNHETAITDLRQQFPPQYHASVVTEILNVALDKSAKEIHIIIKLLTDLVVRNIVSAENFIAGLTEILNFAPDLSIDIPKLYDYLGKLMAAQIENKYMTFEQAFTICDKIISSEHGHLILRSIIKELKESMGPSFVKSKWIESGLKLSQWMSDEQVPKWMEDNKFEFLEGGTPSEESKKILTPVDTTRKLLQLMNSEESIETVQGWVQDNIGASSSEDWFLRALSQAICEYALYGLENRDVPHFSLERMNKYSPLINKLSESQVEREVSCLIGIQQLIHRLEHPQGLTLEIFQYLHEQYTISVEGFLAWEVTEKEPEGKAVMLKALTSFFTSIKEADNEDSCGED